MNRKHAAISLLALAPAAVRAAARPLPGGDGPKAEIVYDARDASPEIRVTTYCRPSPRFSAPDPRTLTCTGSDGRTVVARRVPHTSQTYEFDGLEPDDYTIEVTSPLYLPWSCHGVRPGGHVKAFLEGSSSVVLVLSNAKTREPVLDYGLSLRFEGADFSPNVHQVRTAGGEHPEGGRYEGWIPHDTTLVVDAPGYAPLEIAVGELEPLVTRHVVAELVRGGTLHGTVGEASGGFASGAAVVVHPAREGYDFFDDSVFKTPERRALEVHTKQTLADAGGSFRFDAIAPGDYVLRAWRGIVATEPRAVRVAHGENPRVELELPATGAIAGRLVGPPGADFTGLGLVARPEALAGGAIGLLSVETRSRLVQVAALEDGRFNLEPVTVGRASVYLAMAGVPASDDASDPDFVAGFFLALGDVDVSAARTAVVDFDLRERFPGALLVDVRVNGQPVPGYAVQAVRRGPSRHFARTSGRLDADSRLRLGPLFAGDWRVYVHGETGWWYPHPALVHVGSGEETNLRIDVPLASGQVRVLDAATGEPLANRRVRVDLNGTWTTDLEGWLDLELPLGRYGLRDGGAGAKVGPETSLEWTAAGPATREVRVTRIVDRER